MPEHVSLHYRAGPPRDGLTPRVSPENAALEQVSLSLLRLPAGGTAVLNASAEERVLVVLRGSIRVDCKGLPDTPVGERDSVFDGPASAVYLPPGLPARVQAATRAEVAVAAAPSGRTDLEPRLVSPAEVRARAVGRDNWARHVYDVVPGDFPADRLIVGETINPPGNWSSSPPHKHDRHDPPRESRFEEVYLYRLDPPQGFGLQRVYTPEGDLDVCFTVEEDDVVALPRGYHPVVAGPGYRLYYLWVLAGEGRDPVWFEDPEHRWIHDLHERS